MNQLRIKVMKKIIFFSYMIMVANICFSQSLVTINPLNMSYYTGYVTDGGTISSDNIRVGYYTVGTTIYRGYIKFNIPGATFPPGSVIQNIELHFYVSVAGASTHQVMVRGLNSDPTSLPGMTLYNSIGTGTQYLTSYVGLMNTIGWKTISLNSNAVSNLQSNYYQGWWAIGLQENGDNSEYAIASGYSANNPYCNITYYAPPTIQASNISFSNVTGNSMQINWAIGNGQKRAVFIKMASTGTAAPVNSTTYTGNNIFGSGSQIGTSGWYCVYNGTANTVTVTGLTQGSSYQVHVCEYNGIAGFESYNTNSSTNNPANQSTTGSPTVQASNVICTNITSSSMQIGWANGNGSGRIVFITQGTTGTASPVNGTNYIASTTYGSGSLVSGWYCVYDGSGSTVQVIGFSAGTTYRIHVCEYLISGGKQYLTTSATNNPLNQATCPAAPGTQASSIIFSNVSNNSMTLNWTNGNGSNRLVFITTSGTSFINLVNGTTYTANSTYGSGSSNGGAYCVYNGSGSTVSVTGLAANTYYTAIVFEYNGTGGCEQYLTYTTTGNPNSQTTTNIPSTQATNVTFSNISTSGMQINWTNGNGSARVVFMKQDISGTSSPVNGTSYTANTVYGSGSQVGGWYCIYGGTGTSVSVTGLTANTTYRVHVCEYNEIDGNKQYQTTSSTNNPMNQSTCPTAPTIASSYVQFSNLTSTSVSINWTRGNGTNCLLIMEGGFTNYSTMIPVNGTTYTASTTFGSGSPVGIGYCVYNGSGSSVNVTGLTTNLFYLVWAIEYNGSPGCEQYLTGGMPTNNPNDFTTCGITPTIQASNILFSNVMSNNMSPYWTNGNGSKRLVFITQGSSGTASPVDGITYTANQQYGLGSPLGSWYCIYNGTSNGVNIMGLQQNTVYRVQVFEYNGEEGCELYLTATGSNNPANQQTCPVQPSVQSCNIIISNLTNINISFNWTPGSGTNRIVFMKTGTTGTVSPLNGNTYMANSAFGLGSSVGGWFCVYNGSGNSVSVTGLSQFTGYRIHVCEYNGNAGCTQYLSAVATQNPLNFTTCPCQPAMQASSVSFSNIAQTGMSVSWITGNGEKRAVFMKASPSSSTASPTNATTYTGNTQFGSGTQIGSSGWYCIYNGTGTTVSASGLSANTTYWVHVCEYNGSPGYEYYNTSSTGSNPNSQQTLPSVPTTQAHNISFSNIGATSMTISWQNGNGSSRIVFIKNDTTGMSAPVNNTSYTANSSYGNGSALGGWYCIYNGLDTFVQVTGLQTENKYIVHVCEYNGNPGNEQYLTTAAIANPAVQQTLSTPTVQASNIVFSNNGSNSMTISWNNGNGSKRVVFMKQNTLSGTVTLANGTTYTAGAVFGSGTSAGGWYCIYNGSQNTVQVTGLSPLITYRVHVCEYNGNAGVELYLTSQATNNPSINTTCPSPPSVQSKNLYLTNILSSSFTLHWTIGNGTGRVVFIKEGSSGEVTPANGNTYSANTAYGSGSECGGWYCVYNGTGSTVTISSLSQTSIYRIQVCEYNGPQGCEQYLTAVAQDNPLNMTFTNCTWVYAATDLNHLIVIPANCATIGGTSIAEGDFIGVFYNDGGIYKCGGYVQYYGSGGNNTILFAYGDDETTEIKDGFESLESFTWRMWKNAEEEEYDAVPIYLNSFPNQGQFVENGLSGIDSLYTYETQIINLPQGWCIFSTYINLPDPLIAHALTSIIPYFVLVKNGNGQVFWPQYYVNTIVNMAVGMGYQILMNSTQNLSVNGPAVVPQLTPVSLGATWSMIGYLRKTQGQVSSMLSSISNCLIIVKNGDGNVYWPLYNVDNIGNLLPGKGYQIKCSCACTLTYPAN
jgi:hypothetical protein